MKIEILTLFPKTFDSFFKESLIGRACDKKIIEVKIHNLRDWAIDKHKNVDDRPYGGGPGMVLKVDVIDRALKDLKNNRSKIILLTPQGKVFNQKIARKISKIDHLILICGHYEGFDERIRRLVDEEISIGDYILTGGELPAMVLSEAVLRLVPSVVGKKESLKDESFSKNFLEYPQYTRPENYKSLKVPSVLLSGNHKEIIKWREKKALSKTKRIRPDLLK